MRGGWAMPMRTLTDVESAAVVAIVSAPEAWSWAEALPAGAYRRDVESMCRPWAGKTQVRAWLAGLAAAGHTGETLASLQAAGWIDPWRLDEEIRGAGRAWTLSVWAMDAMGLTLADEWGFERVEVEEFVGCATEPDRPWWRSVAPDGTLEWTRKKRRKRKAGKVWRRKCSEEPRWTRQRWRYDNDGIAVERTYPPVVMPDEERLGVGLAGWEGEAAGLTPEEEALANEAARLLALFEADPANNLDSFRLAELIVEGLGAEVRRRWLWDEATDLPRLVFGRLVPREKARRRAG